MTPGYDAAGGRRGAYPGRMTQWGVDAIFNPSKRHMDEEKRRLQATRQEVGDNSGGQRIDLLSGTVRIQRPTDSPEADSPEAGLPEAGLPEAEVDPPETGPAETGPAETGQDETGELEASEGADETA
jgi:hypothetical protein